MKNSALLSLAVESSATPSPCSSLLSSPSAEGQEAVVGSHISSCPSQDADSAQLSNSPLKTRQETLETAYISHMGVHLPTDGKFWLDPCPTNFAANNQGACENTNTSNTTNVSNNSTKPPKPPLVSCNSKASTDHPEPPSFEKQHSVAEEDPCRQMGVKNKQNNNCPKLRTACSFEDHIAFLRLYRKYFFDKEHFNFIATQSSSGSIVMSVRCVPLENCLKHNNNAVTLVLLRTADRTFFYSGIIDDNNISSAELAVTESSSGTATPDDEHRFGFGNLVSSNPVFLAKHVVPSLEVETFCPLPFSCASRSILEFDEFSIQTCFKFGVVYQRAGQYTEEELFSNTQHSEVFDRFLDVLGDRIKLKGFDAYRGGLDVSNKIGSGDGGSGTEDERNDESVYTKFNWPIRQNSEDVPDVDSEQIEVMFHVSTMLPFTPNDTQQLARKRHIGNDIVSIVFQEEGAVFNPSAIASHFLHVYIVVQPMVVYPSVSSPGNSFDCRNTPDNNLRYRVITVARCGVPLFLPDAQSCEMAEPLLFEHNDDFRDFLLRKLINAEVACYQASTFANLQLRTRRVLFDSLARDLFSNAYELFSGSGGLRSPSSLMPIKSSYDQSDAAINKDHSSGTNKRSGSILKSLKRTFRRQRPPSLTSIHNESGSYDNAIPSITTPVDASENHFYNQIENEKRPVAPTPSLNDDVVKSPPKSSAVISSSPNNKSVCAIGAAPGLASSIRFMLSTSLPAQVSTTNNRTKSSALPPNSAAKF